MHYVYILYSPAVDRFYIGETANPDQRLQHHRAGHQRYTRRASDWIMVFCKPTVSRDDALDMEQRIKMSKSRKTLLRWIRGPDNQVSPADWNHLVW